MTALLRLNLQKGVRQLLPDDGECEIELVLDGAALLRGLRLQGGSSATLCLPLCQTLETREHRLIVRLGRRSETTLRIHAVTVTRK